MPVEIVASLLDGLNALAHAALATREYLESGLCSDDYALLPLETPEEAEWHLQFCRAAHAHISAQLERAGWIILVREAGTHIRSHGQQGTGDVT
jgi:hypothetical protein